MTRMYACSICYVFCSQNNKLYKYMYTSHRMVDINCEQSLCLAYSTTSLRLTQEYFKKIISHRRKKFLPFTSTVDNVQNLQQEQPIVSAQWKHTTKQVTVIRQEVYFVIINSHWIDRLHKSSYTGLPLNSPQPNQCILTHYTWFKYFVTCKNFVV